RRASRARLGRDVRRELDRAFVRGDVDHVPACNEIAGLGQRAVGDDGCGIWAAVAHPGAVGSKCLRVDELAVFLKQFADVPEEGHMRLDVLGSPLVHRGKGTVRRRGAAVVLEKQVLRHGVSYVLGLAYRGPSPVERSRSQLLDMQSRIELRCRGTVGLSGSLVVVTAESGLTRPDAGGLLPLRRNRDFILLQFGQLLSSFGSSLSTIAYPLLTLAVTHSPAKAGYVSAMLFAPILVFGLAAGLAADRFDRRRLMIASDIVGAGALATIGWAIIAGDASLWLIL